MAREMCGASLTQQQGSRWDAMTPVAARSSPSGSICTESWLVPSTTTDGGKVRQRGRAADGAGTQSSRDPIPHSSTETLSHPTSGPIATLPNVISKLSPRGQLKVPRGETRCGQAQSLTPELSLRCPPRVVNSACTHRGASSPPGGHTSSSRSRRDIQPSSRHSSSPAFTRCESHSAGPARFLCLRGRLCPQRSWGLLSSPTEKPRIPARDPGGLPASA